MLSQGQIYITLRPIIQFQGFTIFCLAPITQQFGKLEGADELGN